MAISSGLVHVMLLEAQRGSAQTSPQRLKANENKRKAAYFTLKLLKVETYLCTHSAPSLAWGH